MIEQIGAFARLIIYIFAGLGVLCTIIGGPIFLILAFTLEQKTKKLFLWLTLSGPIIIGVSIFLFVLVQIVVSMAKAGAF